MITASTILCASRDARATDALLITQFYRPELVGSAPFCAELAEWLVQSGWDAAVLTGRPNYPNGEDFAAYRDGSIRQERIDGVSVHRLRSWLPKRRSTAGRIFGELCFFLDGLRAFACRRIKRRTLTISLCPSILTVLLGSWARAARGRHVAIVHDIQSGLAQNLGMIRASWFLRGLRSFERRVFNRVDLILVLTEEMKIRLRQMGVTASIEILPIWADTERIRPVASGREAGIRVIYSGSFGRKQNIGQIMALAADLKQRAPEITILMRGRGREFEAFVALATSLGLTNIHFADLVPREEIFAGQSDADIHLVVHDLNAADFAVPSKIYNIMAAGLPCVVQAREDTALGHLHRDSGGFLRLDSYDVQELGGAILHLARDRELRRELGRCGRRYVEEKCSKKIVLGRLVERLKLQMADTAAPRARRGTLIFEPEFEGHSLEWLRHLLRYASADSDRRIVWLVVPERLHRALVPALRGVDGDFIRILSLKPAEERFCRHPWLVLSSMARWWVATRYLSRTRAGALHFLALDLLSFPLALGLPFSRPVSGILFRPSAHYRFLGPHAPSWRERLRDRRKVALYKRMLSRPALSAILSLDPYFARYAARTYKGGTKIRPITDPMDDPVRTPAPPPFLATLPSDRLIFLFFGYLTRRKGTLKLVEALQLLPEEIQARSAFVLAGRVEASIRQALRHQLATLKTTAPKLTCHLEDRWLAAEEIEALVGRSDAVLAPYQRFVGSSGVMVWAARFGKPLLTQDFGMLGCLTRDYGLGLTVDCTNSLFLAEAIAQFIRTGPHGFIDLEAARAFLADRSPALFAETVLRSAAA